MAQRLEQMLMLSERPGIGRRSSSRSRRSHSNSSRYNSDTAADKSLTSHNQQLVASSSGGAGGPYHRIRSSSAQPRRVDRTSSTSAAGGGSGVVEYHQYSRYPPKMLVAATTTTPQPQHQQQRPLHQQQQLGFFQSASANDELLLLHTQNQNHHFMSSPSDQRRHHSHGSIPIVPRGDSSDAGSAHSVSSSHQPRSSYQSPSHRSDSANNPQRSNNNIASASSNNMMSNRNRGASSSGVVAEYREPPLPPQRQQHHLQKQQQQQPHQTQPQLHMHYSNNSPYSKIQRLSASLQQQDHQHQHQIGPQHKQLVNASLKAIDELKKASDPSYPADRRTIAISNARSAFDHNDDSLHDIELQKGAPSALCKILADTLPEKDDDVRALAAALEMVFRGRQEHVHAAFDKCGNRLLPLLLRFLDGAEAGRMKHSDAIILSLLKVLLYISRVPHLRVPLAKHAGMLDTLTRASTTVLPPESRVARTRIVANLVNTSEDNKVALLQHGRFVESLLRTAHLDTDDRAREYAVVALMDLASAAGNQVPMAKNEKLVGTLVKMVLVEKIAGIRESAITALQNLAFTKENRSRLVAFKQGIVIEALRKALSGDKHDKSRRRAAGALTNLACDETAEGIGSHKGLLDTLAIVSTKDESSEVQTRSAMALTKLAASITARMPCYPTLLDALVVASLSSSSNSVSAVLRVKARDPENREPMAHHPGILDTLADICLNTGGPDHSTEQHTRDRDNAMRAIMHLTNEAKNRKIMCNKIVLDALVQGASIPDPDVEGNPTLAEIRDSAVRAIERLATEFTNRATMARHEGLLVAIARATEREAKWEAAAGSAAAGTLAGAKAAVIAQNGIGDDTANPLAHHPPQPHHAYLAKPLLMSLLVAM